jgi:uridine kinase
VLGRELATLIAPHREVHRVSVDGFHRPRSQRYARGRTPETFYRDSYDNHAIRRLLLEPFPAGSPWVRAVHDVEREAALVPEPQTAGGSQAVLLVDGIFLHRPELAGHWDASVWVDVPFAVSVPRGKVRLGEVDAEAADPGIRHQRTVRRRAADLPRRGGSRVQGHGGARQHRPHRAGAQG